MMWTVTVKLTIWRVYSFKEVVWNVRESLTCSLKRHSHGAGLAIQLCCGVRGNVLCGRILQVQRSGDMLSIALIIGIGVTAWIAWIAVEGPKKVYRQQFGMCDTIECKNKATMHHGLEEWYCEPCDRAYNGRS